MTSEAKWFALYFYPLIGVVVLGFLFSCLINNTVPFIICLVIAFLGMPMWAIYTVNREQKEERNKHNKR